jgi:hypothetical protein
MSTSLLKPSVTFVDSVNNRSTRLFPFAQQGTKTLHEVNNDNTVAFWLIRPSVNMYKVHVLTEYSCQHRNCSVFIVALKECCGLTICLPPSRLAVSLC